jgi:hypothetical protein
MGGARLLYSASYRGVDNFTVSLRMAKRHGYFILPILVVELEYIILNKKRAFSIVQNALNRSDLCITYLLSIS